MSQQRTRVYGGVTVTKKTPVQPDWHKNLVALAKQAGGYRPAASPEVIAFKNYCRRLVTSRVLKSWAVNGTHTIYSVEWVAADPHWSGRS